MMKGDEKMKVATFNTNSIRSRLQVVIPWLQREETDVLCLQETKVQDSEFPVGAFEEIDYHVVFRGQKAYSGVAIVSREEPQEVAIGFSDGGEPDGARLIRAVVRGIPIVNTYVPQGRSPDSPHFQYKLEWFARLRALFEQHYSPQEPLLWMGDFNVAPEPIDVHDPKRLKDHVDFHPEARATLERVKEWGFVDVFRLHHPQEPEQYTFWDYRAPNALERKIGWRVDHIWATEPLAHKSTRAWIDVEARRAKRPSDHTFLVAEFAL
ncbi:MAG: exodeoxyribonuclease III [Chloroflexota bacterium]|nr:exodeoxyribonuclease III [Chloroflexota bacterium]